ncbi:MAG: hypothetical protein WBI17_02445 [Clostridiaceae bacterium]
MLNGSYVCSCSGVTLKVHASCRQKDPRKSDKALTIMVQLRC